MSFGTIRLGVCAALVVVTALLGPPSTAEEINPTLIEWEVIALIDQSREPFPEAEPATLPGQFFTPRDARGLAISPDGRFLYVGFNNSKVVNDGGTQLDDRNGEVRMIDLSKGINDDQWVTRVTGNRGKALAVDDQGRVYMAEAGTGGGLDRIDVFSADLSTKLHTINLSSEPGGVAVTREANQLVLYTSSRSTGELRKFELSENGADIDGDSLDNSFDSNGILALPGSADLRGVEIDGEGNVWVAAFGSNQLFRVTPSGVIDATATISTPFDIGFDGNQVLVTHHEDGGNPLDRTISLFTIADFDADSITANASTLIPPWLELFLDPNGDVESGDVGALSGIVVIPGVGFYVTNELGQTADQMSLYGPTDAFSGAGFQDQFFDDNDPILFARIPEPAAIVLAALAFAGFLGYLRRQRR